MRPVECLGWGIWEQNGTTEGMLFSFRIALGLLCLDAAAAESLLLSIEDFFYVPLKIHAVWTDKNI